MQIKPKPDFNQLLKVLWHKEIPDYVPFYELYADLEIMETILGKKVPDRTATIEFYYKTGYDYVPVWPFYEMKVGSLIDTSTDYLNLKKLTETESLYSGDLMLTGSAEALKKR